MAVKISAVSTRFPSEGASDKHSTVKLSSRVITEALSKSELDPNDVGVIVSAAVFKEDNIGEPAVAALIQKEVGANVLATKTSSTFSFDIKDGGCGLITGMELISGIISSGTVTSGVIVTSDVNPDIDLTIGFPFESGAAAIVFQDSGDPSSGLVRFSEYDYPEYRDLLHSSLKFGQDPRTSEEGVYRNILFVNSDETKFLSVVTDIAAKALRQFLEEIELDINEIDLLIPSQYPRGLSDGLISKAGLDGDTVVTVQKTNGPQYTAGIGSALLQAQQNGSWGNARHILFLGVSPGIKISLAYYLNPDHEA